MHGSFLVMLSAAQQCTAEKKKSPKIIVIVPKSLHVFRQEARKPLLLITATFCSGRFTDTLILSLSHHKDEGKMEGKKEEESCMSFLFGWQIRV